MISHQYRCFFFHPIKCGGSTIESLLGFPGKKMREYEKKYEFRHTRAIHMKKKHPKEFDSYFKFGATRNPWERLVSRYFSFHKKNSDGTYAVDKYEAKQIRKSRTFKEAVMESSLLDEIKPTIDDFTVDGEDITDYIIRMETFEKDVRKVMSILKVPLKEVPKINSSEHGPYQGYYDSELEETVYEHLKKDIIYFGYKFG
tara:strand:+ start:35 stop:634 length:600 start_codon:yes stop_codon:yes gene_type:complete